jgi:hypothetical protein
MGRVRRYKKVKNVDPFSKQRKRDGTDVAQRDDPPDLFEEKGVFIIV